MKRMLLICLLCISVAVCGCAAAEPAPQPGTEAERLEGAACSEVAMAVDQAINEYNASRSHIQREAEASSQQEKNPDGPIALASHASSMGDCYIIFPQVQGVEAADAINDVMCSRVKERADELGLSVFTEYRVEYNRNGIFSVRIFLYDLYGAGERHLDCIPLTFNADTGELLSISDLFSGGDNRWRGRIPDMIAAQAADDEMILLNDLLPISDDRDFYITNEAVVIMYDLYEISIYSAGEPEFQIPVDELAEYLGEASPLNVFLSPSPEPLPASTATPSSAEPPAPEDTPAVEATPEAGETPGPSAEPELTPPVEPEHTLLPEPVPTPTPAPAIEEGAEQEAVQ